MNGFMSGGCLRTGEGWNQSELDSTEAGRPDVTTSNEHNTGLSQDMADAHVSDPMQATTAEHEAAQVSPGDDRLVSLLEDHIAVHADYIQSDRATLYSPPTLHSDRLLKTFDDVHAGLVVLGYNLDNPVPWERLGIHWDEGPLPDENVIENRLRLAVQLLSAAARHQPEAASKCNTLSKSMQADASNCLAMLPALARARRQRTLSMVPRHKEVEMRLLQYLRHRGSQVGDEWLLVQLSNLQQANLSDLHAQPLAARALLDKLGKDPAAGAKALEDTGAQAWLCWAPEDATTAGRWAAMHKVLSARRPLRRLSLLVSRPIFPGRLPVADLLDYWRPAVLKTDLAKRIESLQLLEPPVRVMISDKSGPRVVDQHLAILTLNNVDCDLPNPELVNWAGTVTKDLAQEAVVLDFPQDNETAILGALSTAALRGMGAWSRSRPSPADRNDRRVMYGYTGTATYLSPLEVEVLIRDVRSRLQGIAGVAIGHTTVMRDAGALVMDYTTAAGAAALTHFCDQVIFLTAHLGVLTTSTPRSTWESALTHQAEQDAEDRITKLSWRRSTRRGGVWAAPQVLSKNNAATMMDDWHGVAGPSRCNIHVQFRGDAGDDPSTILEHLTTQLTAACGCQWTPVAMDATLLPQQIAPVRGRHGHWDGGFLLVSANPAMTQQVASILNGLCFAGSMGPQRLQVQINHDYAGTSVRRQGNGARRRR